MTDRLRSILALHAVISLAVTVFLGIFLSWQHASSFGLGAGLMGLNWWVIAQTWARVLGKKSIALAVSIIVIKWTLFGAICVVLARAHWVMPISLIIGISSVLVSALIVASRSNKRAQED